MKNILLLILLSFPLSKIIAQSAKIDSIFYGNYGGKRVYTNSYFFTKDSITKNKEYTDITKGDVKISNVNSIENWNDLLSNIDIKYFRKIKSGRSQTAFCGSDTYITLKLKNGETIKTINAYTDDVWSEIKKRLEKLKNKIE